MKLKKNEAFPISYLSPIIPNSKVRDTIVYNENYQAVDSPNVPSSYLNWVFYILKDDFLSSPKYLHIFGLDLDCEARISQKIKRNQEGKETMVNSQLDNSENAGFWNNVFPNDKISTVAHFRQEIKQII